MNKAGRDYCKEQSKAASKLAQSLGIKIPNWTWTHTKIQERILRLSIELEVYDVYIEDTQQVEELAVATLKEDWVKRNKPT